MNISAVVATRNRPQSLFRLLNSLRRQEYPVGEIIIVDSSDLSYEHEVRERFPDLPIRYEKSFSSACHQRNRGIQLASGTYILLCDDDLEFPPEYVRTLVSFLDGNCSVGAISGLCVEVDEAGAPQPPFRSITLLQLLWLTLFQLTVWADISRIRSSGLGKFVHTLLERYYAKRGNTFSLAGWPLVVRHDSVFHTSIFTLGGALVKRDWLVHSPFDEILDEHGIGDHYGVALHFPQPQPILVITGAVVLHHRSSQNRLPRHLAYYRRVLALHYFMKTSDKFSKLNRGFLIWSLFGNLLYFALEGESRMSWATIAAMLNILSGRNPYLLARQSQMAGPVSPRL